MKKLVLLTAVALAALTVIASGAATPASNGASAAAARSDRPSSGRKYPRACAPLVENMLARMTLAEKVGQMVMVLNAPGFGDFTDTVALIRDHHVGSVVSHAYFGLGPADAAAYNNILQDAASRTRLGIPILNAADFEAGVTILVSSGTELPTEMALGATRRSQFARTSAEITAAEARAMGFQWTFSPVADVVTTPLNGEIGVRSFGGDPHLVARLTATQVRAYQRAGLIATAKHFPGLGGSEVNSHFDLPRVTYGLEELVRTHLPPFEAAVRADVDAIMTGHVVIEAVDPELPATLSAPVTTGLLRNRLGYDGVIVTDSMTLGAVVDRWGIGEAAVMAVQAGADIVMEIGPTEVPLIALQAIASAVASGEISETRVNASVRRVLGLKCKYGVFDKPLVDPAAAAREVGTAENAAEATEISQHAITLIRNEGVLPFDAAADSVTLVAGVTHHATVIPTPPLSHVPALVAAVERVAAGSVVTWASETEEPTEAEIAAAAELAARADRIIVATYSAGVLPQAQAQLVKALLATGKPLVAIATGTPYDIAHYPDVDAYLASYALTFLPTYAFSPVLLRAAIDVVFGADPRGRLPVPIPGLYPFGHGLKYGGGVRASVDSADEG
jgi:beta-N-acetylhexosaminidase